MAASVAKNRNDRFWPLAEQRRTITISAFKDEADTARFKAQRSLRANALDLIHRHGLEIGRQHDLEQLAVVGIAEHGGRDVCLSPHSDGIADISQPAARGLERSSG